jgi:hypothetical protein
MHYKIRSNPMYVSGRGGSALRGGKYGERPSSVLDVCTDCVSFALMRRHDLNRAFTFDRHFADAGFEVVPRV